ncbi:MAG: hypothetical protein JW737_02990 [Acidobacteria bacterium]|nr:hypothetical protein [Acidobacteriota bacterium]
MNLRERFNAFIDFFSRLDTALKRMLYLFVSTLLGITIGILFGVKILLPLFAALPAYLLMLYLLKAGRRKSAVLNMLSWAVMLGVLMTASGYIAPVASEAAVFKSTKYKTEMFRWVQTGVGSEGDPAQFIPQHLLHLCVFLILSLLTMSFISIYFGAVLMNYMAFYVSQLMLCTDKKILMFLLGWHFWSLFRIAGFVILGVVLAEVIGHRLFKYKWSIRDIHVYLIIAFTLIVLDILTKAIFAPAIGEIIRPMLIIK